MKEGWCIKKMQELCEKITDGTHQTPKYFEEGVVFLSSKNVTSGKIDWDNVKYLDEAQHKELQKRVAPKIGDILLAKNGTTGVAAIVDRDVVFDIYVSLAWLRSLGEVTPEYLWYYINSPLAKKQFNSRLKGIGVPNLHLKEIKEVSVPVPPLQEQQQIVEKLDQAFELIDQAKANIEQNIVNAKELFQSKLDEVFSQKGDGWEENCLGNLSTITYGCTEKALEEDTGIKYLRITDINNGEVEWDSVPFCNLISADEEKYKLVDGDIVFARTGATTGKSYIYHDNVNSVYASYLIRLQINDKKMINPDFVYWFFQSGDYWRTIKKGMSGSTLGGFNAKKLSEIVIHFPKNLDKQLKCIMDFEETHNITNALVCKYQQKLDNLEELRKSILEKAFRGELTN